MIAYAVYIISSDGRPFVSVKFQSADYVPDDLLLSGLFTAIQLVATDIIGKESEIKTMKIENFSYHFKSFGYFRVVLVSNKQETPENVIHKLGWRFMKEYGEKVVDIGIINDQDFKPFENIIKEIIIEDFAVDESNLINPNKKFSTGEIYLLESILQQTALSLISLKEGTIREIAQESGLTIEMTSIHIRLLQERGLVGRKNIEGGYLYFCSL